MFLYRAISIENIVFFFFAQLFMLKSDCVIFSWKGFRDNFGIATSISTSPKYRGPRSSDLEISTFVWNMDGRDTRD